MLHLRDFKYLTRSIERVRRFRQNLS